MVRYQSAIGALPFRIAKPSRNDRDAFMEAYGTQGSRAVARLVVVVPLLTHQASDRVLCVLGMNRPGVHGGAGLAPAIQGSFCRVFTLKPVSLSPKGAFS